MLCDDGVSCEYVSGRSHIQSVVYFDVELFFFASIGSHASHIGQWIMSFRPNGTSL